MHSLPAISKAHRLTEEVRQQLPRVFDSFARSNQEAVQTTVWLVGLSSGFLAFLAAKPELLTALGQTKLLVATLLGTVAAGVAQRLAAQVWFAAEHQLMMVGELTLWAMLQDSMPQPPPVDVEWSKERTLANMEQYFGWLELPLATLRQDSVPAQACHDLYDEMVGRWLDWEATRARRLVDFSDAIQAKASAPISGEEVGDEEDADWLAGVRSNALATKIWRRVATSFYFATALLFAGSCWLLARSIWAVIPPMG